MKESEEDNNRLFIDAYGLQDELSAEVPDDQITLYRPNREEDMKRLISYAIGCMMGRYSLDKPGLIYAHSGNVGFDPSQYKTFPADSDGIVPLTEAAWFADDAANRFVEFIGVAWPKEHLDENLKFVADSLGPATGRAAPRHDPPLPRHGVLQAPPVRSTSGDRSTGSSPAANSGPSSASSTCTATTRARCPGCGRSMSSRSKARLPPASNT